jgi:Ca2+-binding EF-hand superfamily protein
MTYVAIVGPAAIGTLVGGTLGVRARSTHASFAAIDSDHDGKLNLDEIKKAAAEQFDALDSDHDGTLTRSELRR